MFLRRGNNNLDNSKRKFFVFVEVFFLIMLVAGGGYFVWNRYFSKEAKEVRAFKNYQKEVEEAYKNDIYGGVTPEETLKLFVEALKKEDIELASKYFSLDDNLSREKWLALLIDIKNKNNLNKFAEDIKNYNESNKSFGLYHLFIYRNIDGTVALQITMELNPVSKVWKIESL